MIEDYIELSEVEREAETKQNLEAIKNALLKDGGVDELVNNQRIPVFESGVASHTDYTRQIGWNLKQGGVYGRVSEAVVICHIQPQGTQFGDTYDRVIGIGAYEFFSPEGNSRGLAQTVMLTVIEAIPLQSKLEIALQCLS